MAKPNETNETSENGTNGAWEPNKAVFNREMKAVQVAQAEADKAQEAADAAREKVSKLVIAFLEEHGKPAPKDKDGKVTGEPSYPEVDSQLFGARVQPVIRNSETKDGKKSRTGFIKRFGAKSVPKF